jgi:hypothetical protein
MLHQIVRGGAMNSHKVLAASRIATQVTTSSVNIFLLKAFEKFIILVMLSLTFLVTPLTNLSSHTTFCHYQHLT